MEVSSTRQKRQSAYAAVYRRPITLEQKVDAVTQIIMTGCPKVEVARNLNVAESTFRGWCKNKEIVARAYAKYQSIKYMAAASAKVPAVKPAFSGSNTQVRWYGVTQGEYRQQDEPAAAASRPLNDSRIPGLHLTPLNQQFYMHAQLARYRSFYYHTLSQQTAAPAVVPHQSRYDVKNAGTESRSSSLGRVEEEEEEDEGPLDLTTHSRSFEDGRGVTPRPYCAQ